MIARAVAIAFAVLVFLGAPAAGALPVPDTIAYQAFLSEASGAPVDGAVDVEFRLYDVESGGVELWSQALLTVVEQGLLTVTLGGAASPFGPTLFEQPLWLGVSVGGDAEMTPRRPFSSAAFSFRAANADGVADGAITSTSLAPGAVTSASIAPGAVSAASLAPDAVTLESIGVACAPGETLVSIPAGWECGTVGSVECIAGDFLNCYNGAAGTLGIGTCQAGLRTCQGDGTFGACENEVIPAAEICDDMDNDCNGLTDDGIECRACTDQEVTDVAACSAACGIDLACFTNCTDSAGVTTACVTAVNDLGLCAFANGCGDVFNLEDADCIATNCLAEYEDVFGELLPDCSPGAIEVCYGGPPGTDGVGQCQAGLRTCSAAGYWGACGGQVLPDTEICDFVDNNCNGAVDDNPVDAIQWFPDMDNDSFGGMVTPIQDCAQPPGPPVYVDNSDDCNDMNADINPDAPEICDDGVDNDCDDRIDAADPDCP